MYSVLYGDKFVNTIKQINNIGKISYCPFDPT